MSESTNYLLGKMDAQDLMLGKTDNDASNFSAFTKSGYGFFAPVLSAHFGATAATTSHAEITAPDRAAAAEWLGKPEIGDIFICACGSCGPDSASYQKNAQAFSPPANLGGMSFSGGVAAPSELLVDGTIGGGEIDAYAVNLVAGETYFFSVYGSGDNPLGDTFLYVIDNTGAGLLDYDDDGGAGVNSVLTYTATYTGLHYIGVGAYPGSGLTGDYTLDLFEFPDEDFVSDTFEDAPVLPANGVTYGFIDGGPEGPYAGYSEVDTYAIQVEAGKIYTIEVAGGADYESDYVDLRPGELDTILQLFDSEGNFVAGNDDISFPGDVSSRISFIATESGTYYLDVLAYLNLTSGEFQTGGYTITTQEVDPADLDPLDSLIWQSAANVQFDETNTAYVYFAAPGENFGETADDGVSPMPSFGWNEYEIQQVMLALEEYEKILGVNYEITTDVNEATFRLITTESEQFGAFFYPQDPAYGDAQGIGAFNVLSGGWSFDQQQSLEQGGFSFAVILHEFGHAHGLSHPHDRGGGSDVMLGVTASQGSFGLYDLNQGVYTVMSYNDAWQLHPDGPSPFTAAGIDNGWSGTLSAFDIAALQERYGVNNPYATGNDTYLLKDSNDQGTYYETIWDTGGTDVIRYDGARNARIDLLAATIDYSPTGGGVISFVDGIWGGYTIAKGVVIENASGGGGNDALLGNAANNVLSGNAGDDVLMGREGADTLNGGAGFDIASYMDASSGVVASLASNSGSGGEAAGDRFISIEGLQGSEYGDVLIGGNNGDQLDGLGGNDTLTGGNNNDVLLGGDGDDQMNGGNGDDALEGGDGADHMDGGNGSDWLDGGAGNDTLIGGNNNDTLYGRGDDDDLDGGNGDDALYGGAGSDTLVGGNGNDTLDGGDHADYMSGGNGNDWFDGGAGNDTVDGGNGNDTAYGGAGADYMEGGNGNDWFDGGAGNDTLIGDNGNDTMNGGQGNDLFYGGNGKDVFVFTDLGGVDEIADFKKNQDKIDLSGLDAINGGALDSFNWIGSAAFSNTAGELRAYSASGENYVAGDTDGDGVADFTIVTNVLISEYDILFA